MTNFQEKTTLKGWIFEFMKVDLTFADLKNILTISAIPSVNKLAEKNELLNYDRRFMEWYQITSSRIQNRRYRREVD
jgi:hypothetical protein